MNKKEKRSRITVLVLTVCLCVSHISFSSVALDKADRNICPHHTQHTEECGYLPATEGNACTHEHTEDCYEQAVQCVHEHSEDCYTGTEDAETGETVSSLNCQHVCGEETGCLTDKLTCGHVLGEHDSECQYLDAESGSPCQFVCTECEATDTDASDNNGAADDDNVIGDDSITDGSDTGNNGTTGDTGETEAPDAGKDPGNPNEELTGDENSKPNTDGSLLPEDTKSPEEMEKPLDASDFEITDAMQALYDEIDALPFISDITFAGGNEEESIEADVDYEELFAELTAIRASYEALSDKEKENFDPVRLETLVRLESLIPPPAVPMILRASIDNPEVELTLPGSEPIKHNLKDVLEALDTLSGILSGTVEIKLLTDADIDEAITFDKIFNDIELNLNGNTLTSSVTDESGITLESIHMSITGDGTFTGDIELKENAGLDIENGTFNGNFTADNSSLTINDGSVTGDITSKEGASLHIEKGTFTGCISALDTSTLTVEDGTFTGTAASNEGSALITEITGNVTLNGGVFSAATLGTGNYAIQFENNEKEIDHLWGDGKSFDNIAFTSIGSRTYGTADSVTIVKETDPAIKDTVTQHMLDKVFGATDVAVYDESANTITLTGIPYLKKPILIEKDVTIDLNGNNIYSSYSKSGEATIILNKSDIELTLDGDNEEDIFADDFSLENEIPNSIIRGGSGFDTLANGAPAISAAADATSTTVHVNSGVILAGGNGANAYPGQGNAHGGNGADAIVGVTRVTLNGGSLIGGKGGHASGNGNGGNGGNGCAAAVTVTAEGKAMGGIGGNVPADGNGTLGLGGSGIIGNSEESEVKNGRPGYHLTEQVDMTDSKLKVYHILENLGWAVFEEADLDSKNRVYATLTIGNITAAADKEMVGKYAAEREPKLEIGSLFSMELTKTSKTASNSSTKTYYETEIPVKLTMQIPQNIQGQESYEIIRIHGGQIESIESTLEENYIRFETDRFSTYAILYEGKSSGSGDRPTGGTGTGGGGGFSSRPKSSTGRWVQNTTGWWYRNNDGTWPKEQWSSLSYNGKSQWYRFDKDGYLITGWFTDTDSNVYYLHPVSDGSMGYMYTGWHQINGSWYYFNETEFKKLGSLFKNGVTPDGYKVNESGVRIE